MATPSAREVLYNLVSSVVGDDGTGDLGVIVDHALAQDPDVAIDDVAQTALEAREDARLERERG
jgi:hypothetical protein